TRFEGPDVYSWKILKDLISPHYHLGEWNTLKIRVDTGKTQCYVNDQLVLESTDRELTDGKVGLAKFRDTRAEFKQFQVGKRLGPSQVPVDEVARILKSVEGLPQRGEPPPERVESMLHAARASVQVLNERARFLEQQA